jgi:hypothetical protein
MKASGLVGVASVVAIGAIVVGMFRNAKLPKLPVHMPRAPDMKKPPNDPLGNPFAFLQPGTPPPEKPSGGGWGGGWVDAPQQPRRTWREEAGSPVSLQPNRIYRAVIDGVPLGASSSAVAEYIKGRVKVAQLRVYAHVSELPSDEWPGGMQEDDANRVWVELVPNGQQLVKRPPQFTSVFSRER